MSERIERMRQAKRQLAGSGEALPAGAVGEEISAEQNAFSTTNMATGQTGFLSITLTPGVWLISAVQAVLQNGSTGTAISSLISDVSNVGNTVTGVGVSITDIGTWPPNNTTSTAVTHPPFVYKTTTNKVIYLNTYAVYSSGTPSRRGSIRAVRIA